MNSEALSSLQIQLEHEHNTNPLPQHFFLPIFAQTIPLQTYLSIQIQNPW
jgi:Kef-type K+ transport system membrane component KefB